MSNADVPTLAMKGLIESVNPFTGNIIDSQQEDNQHKIFTYKNGIPDELDEYKFPDEYMYFEDNISDSSNWQYEK